jgi:hypothetical protein
MGYETAYSGGGVDKKQINGLGSMSDHLSDNGVIRIKKKSTRVCKVAYTLNNHQPVQCSIIGEQPLFYMDFEEDFESSAPFLNPHDLKSLEREINNLKEKTEYLDYQDQFDTTLEDKFNMFFTNAADMFEPHDIKYSDDIAVVIGALQKSRLGNTYLEIAQKHGASFSYNSQIETAFYDRTSGQILLNPNHDFETQILLMARELRRHWQHRQGGLIHPLMFHPDNAVMINRAQTADLAVSMVRIAWELQLTGQKTIWDRLENSSMADLAHAFAREAFLDFRTNNNGVAMAAVFEGWFLSERCRGQDRALIQQMLADYQGYVFELDKSLQGLTPSILAALGSMPYGKNYLASHAQTIMNDTIFTDVRDRSNANFLWFIKFERSFRETEHQLQTPEASATSPSRGASKSHNLQDLPHAEQPAQIIQLYSEQNQAGAQSGDRILKQHGKSDKSADIIYLQRWSSE